MLEPYTDARIVSAEHLAELLDCSRRHVYKLMAEDGLPSVKLGGARRFRLADVDAWLRAQQDAAA